MPGNPELQRQLGSIEELLGKVELAADPSLKTSVRELVSLVMNLHGAGLERMLELIRATGEPGEPILRKLGSDELASSLLILHGLHPLTLESRVVQALDKVRSKLRPHDSEVDLLSVEEGAIRLRLHAESQGCGSSPQSLKQMVEDAVYQAAPDLVTLTIEGADEQSNDKQSFVPLEMLRSSRPAPQAAWIPSLTFGAGTDHGGEQALNGKGGL